MVSLDSWFLQCSHLSHRRSLSSYEFGTRQACISRLVGPLSGQYVRSNPQYGSTVKYSNSTWIDGTRRLRYECNFPRTRYVVKRPLYICARNFNDRRLDRGRAVYAIDAPSLDGDSQLIIFALTVISQCQMTSLFKEQVVPA